MFSTVLSAAIDGMSGRKVCVEADVSDGLPTFVMVGYLASETREASERVRSALRNSGLSLGIRHITVNLAPASLRKQGSGFDLAIAVALLTAAGIIPEESSKGVLFIGELGLSGILNPVRGVLEIVSGAADYGCDTVIVPRKNLAEGSVIRDIEVLGAETLVQVVHFLLARGLRQRTAGRERDGLLGMSNLSEAVKWSVLAEEDTRKTRPEEDSGGTDIQLPFSGKGAESPGINMSMQGDLEPGTLYRESVDIGKIRRAQRRKMKEDFSQIKGQKLLRRASEIAVAGFHNLLMIGPPGAGKTMTAHCLPTIMPEMSDAEVLEVSKIHSIAGKLPPEGLLTVRPYRSPHHTITTAALCGGGTPPGPGEVSLAHRGILYLDEFPEFERDTIETLRQPLEDRKINIARVSGSVSFPAGFMLVASMNPCKCGYFPDRSRCSCTNAEVRRYLSKISMPLLDRIDLCVEARRVEYDELVAQPAEENSAKIRRRVTKAIRAQRERYRGTPYLFNSDLTAEGVRQYCSLSEEEEAMMKKFYDSMSLTARSYGRILKVARTIADLAGEEQILPDHLMEAIQFRAVDRKYWENALQT